MGQKRAHHHHSHHAQKFIAHAVRHKGALHRALGIPEDQRIPTRTLEALATHAKGRLKKQAQLALTLRHLHGR
jgi:hypothetical protein